MLNGLSKILLKYPVPVMTAIMLITGLFFWVAFLSDTRLEVDFSLEQMFPESDPEKDAYDSFIKEFNREDDKILLVYDCDNPTSRGNIAKMSALTEMMELDVAGIENVVSLSNINDGNYFTDKDPSKRKEAAKSFGNILRQNVKIFCTITNTLAKDKATIWVTSQIFNSLVKMDGNLEDAKKCFKLLLETANCPFYIQEKRKIRFSDASQKIKEINGNMYLGETLGPVIKIKYNINILLRSVK